MIHCSNFDDNQPQPTIKGRPTKHHKKSSPIWVTTASIFQITKLADQRKNLLKFGGILLACTSFAICDNFTLKKYIVSCIWVHNSSWITITNQNHLFLWSFTELLLILHWFWSHNKASISFSYTYKSDKY